MPFPTFCPFPGFPEIRLKMDIRNYFNSVPVSSLLHVLKEILADDPFLYSFLNGCLRQTKPMSTAD